MRLSSFLCLTCWCVTIATAQPAAVHIPRLGFAWDGRSNQIRPIHGIPGAAVMGDGIGNTGFAAAVISPRHDLALAVSADNGVVHTIRLTSGDVQALPGVATSPSRMLFSPSGTAALAVGPRIQILTALADSPIVQELAIPPDSGALAAIAVSDDGLVLLSTGSADTASTWLLAPGTVPIQLMLPGPIAVVAFRSGSRDAVAVSSDGTVYQILNSASPGDVRLVYAGEVRTANPVAVRVSADGTRVYTANRLGIVAVIDLATASAAALDCGCSPTGIEPLTSASLFRITEVSDRPVMLFDASTPTPRVWFVPPDATSAGSQRSGQ